MTDFSALIQGWYRQSKRDLPWRNSKDAYKIWLSEIILQQTRVDQGRSYFEKFVHQYPTVFELAEAPQDEVLNLWQGLGYYSRARNLHTAARAIVEKYDGEFPSNFKDIIGLKGVGDYTASAIASIAFELPHAVVDGNVYRVLSRYFADATPIDSTQGKKKFKQIAQDLLDETHPGDHNQALMELGALVCLPRNPACENCPLNGSCMAFETGNPHEYPVKEKKTKVRERPIQYLVLTDGEQVLIKKRKKKDIWQGLYDFPSLEQKQTGLLKAKDLNRGEIEWIREDGQFKHVLSHQRIYATFWLVRCRNLKPVGDEEMILKNEIEDFPLPQLLIRYIRATPFFNAE